MSSTRPSRRDDTAVSAPSPHGLDPLRSAAVHIGAARDLVASAIPDGATGKWIVTHYDDVVPLLRSQVSSVLIAAALHGALANPKHQFFDNDPVRWLAKNAKLSVKDVNELRGCASFLYTPKALVLAPEKARLSPQKQAVIQRRVQADLRSRLVELGIGVHSLMALCSASDRLASSCKHRRIEVINRVLAQAQDYAPDELKSLAAREVNRINKEEKVKVEALRQPSLVYQQADEFGFVSSYSYAPKGKQNQQEALLSDCQRALVRVFRQAGLENPFTGRSAVTQRWLTNDWTLKLGHEVLQRGFAVACSDGDVRLGDIATGANISAGVGKNVTNSGMCSAASRVSPAAGPVSRASLVVYTHIEDLMGPSWRQKMARTNDGNTISLAEALRLTPQGIDHLAVLGEGNEAVIFDVTSDSNGDLRASRPVRSDQPVKQRFATRAQRLLLGLVQPFCAHPGCKIPAIKCQAHHLTAYKQGGATSVENMALLCEFHHPRNDDSQHQEYQGHYVKDEQGIVGWQQHGSPLPPRRYNSRNLPNPADNRQGGVQNQDIGSDSRQRTRSDNGPPTDRISGRHGGQDPPVDGEKLVG